VWNDPTEFEIGFEDFCEVTFINDESTALNISSRLTSLFGTCEIAGLKWRSASDNGQKEDALRETSSTLDSGQEGSNEHGIEAEMNCE
jgi:hypothetical protein